ncbi:GNAT family N-acetyltransferase [Intestinibacter bartlettii]|uniref:GNAT family N-acetyltransferase n=1 Tax=Intestinibacter bartlettii TaxID=261299 RepID=UPI00082213A9|nr:GNAT family N-acetyltransferase [Intestinibacter bartlettii]MCC2706801.1 GNAT family N-acetyltransferase [Intestinibacter bartlettii]MCC2762250.1 GNAT family N-acetyltransferase [Intestinibacter bartlettii]MDU6472673.1 GNAT family N-acetyltransferase [Intestinibacter bartlettii]SCI63163.1 Predicted acetyltransferase involved in intracellular survival and related acetyltransferases [uncultured Clostridium sp.]
MNIRYAKPIDKEQVVSVWNYCFEDGEDFVKYYFENVYDENNTIIIEENDEVLSALQLNKYTIDLRDNKYDVSYVVGVSSKPEVRGLGYMKHLMAYTLEELYKNGEIVSLLMAIDYRLYKRYGFDHCYDQIQYNLRTDELLGFRLSSKLRKATFEDAETLSRIYTKAMESLNGYAVRDEVYFNRFIKEVSSESGYIYIDEENNSYIAYYIQGDTFFVRELIYNNISSLKSMLAYIYNHNTQCKKTVINAPVDDKIKLIIANLKTCEIKLIPFMAGRVINFEKYIESLNSCNIDTQKINNKYIKIKVIDKYIKQNNSVFKISVCDNKIKIQRVEEDYDIELDINSITQLAFSYLNTDEIFMLNEIDESSLINTQKELLNVLFEKRINYIDELV